MIGVSRMAPSRETMQRKRKRHTQTKKAAEVGCDSAILEQRYLGTISHPRATVKTKINRTEQKRNRTEPRSETIGREEQRERGCGEAHLLLVSVNVTANLPSLSRQSKREGRWGGGGTQKKERRIRQYKGRKRNQWNPRRKQNMRDTTTE